MSYYIDNVLKLSFKEWNNFEDYVNNYIENNKDEMYWVPKDVLENGDMIDYLYKYKYLDTNCVVIKGCYNAKSLAYQLIDDFKTQLENDNDKDEEFSYMEFGESVYEDFLWSGYLDEPFIEIDINPNLSGKEQKIDNKLRIIID